MIASGDQIPVPSQWWCKWQALKGTHFLHLPTPVADLRGRNVIISGGNSGIGREAALQFARYGASIVLACRRPPPHEPNPDDVVNECKAAARDAGHLDSTIEWWECDMASFASVEAFAKRWLGTSRSIDILCNNAGIPGASGQVILTKDGKEIVHQVCKRSTRLCCP